MLTAHDHISVFRDGEIERAELRIDHLPRRNDSSFRIECQNCVLAFAARTDSGCQKEGAIVSECKTTRERDHRWWKCGFAYARKGRFESHDRPQIARAHVVPAIRSEVAAAWVQTSYYAAITYHLALAIECQDAIRATIEKQQPALGAEPSRI